LQTVTRFYVGILGGIAGVLGGAWLILAPFALGYQPENAAWADATKVDVSTGIGILVLGLVSVAAFAAGLAAALRAEGALAPRARRAAAPPELEEATGEVAELRSVLARLAAALENHEQTEPSGERHGEPAATPARERRAS
jgi:Na+-transporting methylmalonyl-CoA/oxaloacetate decarboxylase gamma subunit